MTDTELLKALTEHPQIEPEAGIAFEDMLRRLSSGGMRCLSQRQRSWAEGVARRLEIDPGAVNLVSSGVVKPTAKERAALKRTLDSLGPRPLKPPGKS